MIQSWEKPLINHMVMLSIRRTWQATEIAWNEPQVHQGEKIKSWPWGRSASPTWGPTSCKAACKAEMDPGSWWTKSRTWASSVRLWQRHHLPVVDYAEKCQQDEWGDSSPLLSPGETYLECCAPFWASLYKTDMDIWEQVQQRATKMI